MKSFLILPLSSFPEGNSVYPYDAQNIKMQMTFWRDIFKDGVDIEGPAFIKSKLLHHKRKKNQENSESNGKTENLYHLEKKMSFEHHEPG